MKNENDLLYFEEIDDNGDVILENSSGCKTNGKASGCCTTYCTHCCDDDRNPTGDSWLDFLEGNAGIIQY